MKTQKKHIKIVFIIMLLIILSIAAYDIYKTINLYNRINQISQIIPENESEEKANKIVSDNLQNQLQQEKNALGINAIFFIIIILQYKIMIRKKDSDKNLK